MSQLTQWGIPQRALDPDGIHDEDEAPDEREVPVPFANQCECGNYKAEDNYMCDECFERGFDRGGDHQ